MKPFILIVGLFRSGTTLAQELLTQKNLSFIFHEPRFFDMAWQFQNYDRNYLAKEWGLILPQFDGFEDVKKFFTTEIGVHIGAKEIRNQASNKYLEHFGDDLRLIVIDRKPAEIYKSCYKMIMRSNDSFQWRPRFAPFSPVNIFREVMPEIKAINSLLANAKTAARITYADLIDPDKRYLLYKAAGYEVPEPEVGKYHAILPRGIYETKLHGGQVTNRAAGISEIPNKIKEEAEKFENLVNKYYGG